MSAARDSLTLRVGSSEYRGWESVTVSRSLEEAAGSFTLQISGSELISPGAACEVDIGADRVLTGYVDARTREVAGDSATTSVSGRSKTCDLVDCSCITAPAQFKGQTIAQIARALAAPYGVEVVCTIPDLEPLRRWSFEVGESVFDAIERLAREAAALVTDDAQGRLVLTRVADPIVRASDLVCPGNVVRASLAVDVSERYSEVRVKAQRAGDDQDFGAVVAGIEALAEDDGARMRVLVLKGEKAMTPAQAARRAAWEAATRWGKSAQLEVEVASWRDGNGRVWTPNTLAYVSIPRLEVDGDLIIAEVALKRDNAGRTATLSLAPQAAYEPEPPKTSKRKGKSGVALLDREVT